jgi:hypothetical protein
MLMLMIATQSLSCEGGRRGRRRRCRPTTHIQAATHSVNSWSVSPFGTTARAGDVRYRSCLLTSAPTLDALNTLNPFRGSSWSSLSDARSSLRPHDRSRYSTALPDIRDRLRDSTTEAFQSPCLGRISFGHRIDARHLFLGKVGRHRPMNGTTERYLKFSSSRAFME